MQTRNYLFNLKQRSFVTDGMDMFLDYANMRLIYDALKKGLMACVYHIQ